LASNSIAGCYPVHGMQPFDSDKVLADRGYPNLPSGHAKRTFKAIRSERPTPQASLKEIEMKQLLIVLTLVVASAAPAMAEGFPNLYQTNR
jgi:hypothetical protein